MRYWNRWVVAVVSMGCAATALHAGLTGVVNNNSADPGDVYLLSAADLADGELVNIDRTHVFSGLPAEMQGLDYVITANDDKTAPGLVVDLTFDTATTLYLSIDNRVGDDNAGNPPTLGTAMGWVVSQGWQETGLTWGKADDPGSPFTVYTLVFLEGGTHTLYEQDNGGARNMYSVAAEPHTNALVPYVTIDIGPSGQRVESAAVGLAGAPANNAGGQTYGPVTLETLTTDTFDLTISSVDWRDRGDSASADSLARLAEDFVKNNNGTVTLTLDGLRSGRYAATSYHLDPSNTQTPRVQVYVSDGLSDERLQPTQGDAGAAIGGVNNLTTASVTTSAASFAFWSNGSDPVVLRFNGTPGRSNDSADDETPVNGLDLVLDLESRPPRLEPFALIDIGPDGQRVVTDGIGLPNAPGNGNNGPNYGPTALTADNLVLFTLEIDDVNPSGVSVGGIDWRDRGDSAGTDVLVRLGEDHVKNNSGMIRVILGGLPRGTYRVVSYHNDGLASNNLQCEDILVYITDDAGTAVLQALSGDADHASRTLDNITDQNMRATASAFEIKSNGVDDIMVYFDGTGATDTEVPLNGLRIEGIDVPKLGTIFAFR